MTDAHSGKGGQGSAVELSIFNHLLAAAAEEMGARLQRSAFSPNIKERRDFSCAVFRAGGKLYAQAAHIPVHLGSMPLSVQAVLERFSLATLRPGSVYIVNDPYAGGTHLPDITVVAPVYVEGQGSPPLLVANRAHHADIGGRVAGSMALCTTIEDEGLRIGPQLLTDELLESICNTTRTPDERRGDLRAQLASLKAGQDRLAGLCSKYGTAHVAAMGEALCAYTARMMRKAIGMIPDGQYAFTDYLDGDGCGSGRLAIACKLSITGETASCDFSGSAGQVAGPVNAVRAITVSAVNYVLRCLAGRSLPMNGGLLEPVEIITRPGSILDAQYPAAVAAGNVETSQRIVDTVLGALAQAVPDAIPAASCGTMNNITIGGTDPRTGRQFTYYETIAGGLGGGPRRPGAGGMHAHMTNTLNTPVEALEHAYPLRILRYSLRRGSGGGGRQPGGDGLVRVYQFTAPAQVALLGERRELPPYGLAGGSPGSRGRNVLRRNDGGTEQVPGKAELAVEAADVLEIETPGGGGYGQPRQS